MSVAIADHSQFNVDLVKASLLAILPAVIGMHGGQLFRT